LLLSGAESFEAGGAVQKQEVLKAVCRVGYGKAHSLWVATNLICSELSAVSLAPNRAFLTSRLVNFKQIFIYTSVRLTSVTISTVLRQVKEISFQ